MELFENLALGFSVAFSATNLAYCFVGVLLGTFIGVLPGVGPLVTISVLLPLTFGLPPEGALIMLAGIYYGAQYGGSTTAILVNLPGESSAAVTCIDGHQMAKQGRAGPALATAALASFFAGCVGTVFIAIFAPMLAALALEFGPAEYTTLILFALCATASLSQGSLINGIAMAMIGILFGLIGIDVHSGIERFTLGFDQLFEGIRFVGVAMGLFAFTEIAITLQKRDETKLVTAKITGLMPTLADMKASWKSVIRGTLTGSFFGVLPGAGATVSSFAAYLLEKNCSKTPERFGQGAIEGVAGPEAANNAAAQTSFIPTLTLGVPGSVTMALMLGALMIQGITPGPGIIANFPNLFWGLVASMWIGNLMLVLLNLPLVGLWVSLLRLPYRWLYPSILVFSCVGLYTVNFSYFDLYLAAMFSVLGYMFIMFRCGPAPFILGFVLGPMMEENFRRAMLLSRGDISVFVREPVSLFFVLLIVGFFVFLAFPKIRRRKDEVVESESG